MQTTTKCAIDECQVYCPPGHILCRTHFDLVPKFLRGRYYQTRIHGGEAFKRACAGAVRAVNEKLGIRDELEEQHGRQWPPEVLRG